MPFDEPFAPAFDAGHGRFFELRDRCMDVRGVFFDKKAIPRDGDGRAGAERGFGILGAGEGDDGPYRFAVHPAESAEGIVHFLPGEGFKGFGERETHGFYADVHLKLLNDVHNEQTVSLGAGAATGPMGAYASKRPAGKR